MTRLFAADLIALVKHFLKHVSVADLCAGDVYPQLFSGYKQAEIAHDRCYESILVEPSLLFHVGSADCHYLVAVDKTAVFINGQHSVRVAVKSYADIGADRGHVGFKTLHMGRAAAVVDVHAVRGVVYRFDICTQLV